MYLEGIAVLHYNKHDDVIYAYVSKACFIKVNVLAPSSVYSLLLSCMYPRLPSCICVFHVTAMHVQRLACGSEDVTQYNYTIFKKDHLVNMSLNLFKNMNKALASLLTNISKLHETY